MPDPNERPKKYPDENKWIWDLVENLREQLTAALKPLD
jgi:dynein heavy chain